MNLFVIDDIPIQAPKDESGAGEGKNLSSITEEQEEERLTPRGSSLRGKNLPKLPNFPGLGKKTKTTTAGGDVSGRKTTPTNKPAPRTPTIVNGDSELEKKPIATENTNGPMPLDGTTANGSISSEQDRAISESPATTSELSGPSDTQSLFTADSIDLDDTRTPLSARKKTQLEIENRSALQVSSV